MKIYSSLTVNWTASNTIVATITALTFFSEDTSTGVSEKVFSELINISIMNEYCHIFLAIRKGVRQAKILGTFGL